jgi:hypothetical protein
MLLDKKASLLCLPLDAAGQNATVPLPNPETKTNPWKCKPISNNATPEQCCSGIEVQRTVTRKNETIGQRDPRATALGAHRHIRVERRQRRQSRLDFELGSV